MQAKTLLTAAAASVALATTTFAMEIQVNGISIKLGSISCLDGAECAGIGENKPASFFTTFDGSSIDDLNELNELIDIDPDTIIPADTLVRTS
jgi:hypothetical protein